MQIEEIRIKGMQTEEMQIEGIATYGSNKF